MKKIYLVVIILIMTSSAILAQGKYYKMPDAIRGGSISPDDQWIIDNSDIEWDKLPSSLHRVTCSWIYRSDDQVAYIKEVSWAGKSKTYIRIYNISRDVPIPISQIDDMYLIERLEYIEATLIKKIELLITGLFQ